MRLLSSDPAASPLIDPNYWSDPYDREMSLRGLRMAREIMRQPALEKFIKSEHLPGKDKISDEDLITYACGNAKTEHHPVGTCRMGNTPDDVVDSELRVHGIERLRVVDASIMPRVIGANTNAPTIMIAEKAAEMIKRNESRAS